MTTTETDAGIRFEKSYKVGDIRQAVWASLISQASVRVWLAEEAQIEPEAGGPYRFWGRYTPLTPTAEEADQTITDLEEGERLAFTWTWGGCKNDVVFRLEDDGRDTLLTIEHTMHGGVMGYDCNEAGAFIGDLWNLAVGNLREFLKNGKAALRPDYNAAGPDVELSIEIEAPIERVWQSLIDPAQIDRWINQAGKASASVEPQVGGAYSYGWSMGDEQAGPTKILEMDEPNRLVTDWVYATDSTNRTEWTLEDLGGTTRLTVRQVETRTERERQGYTNGWAGFLVVLRGVLVSP